MTVLKIIIIKENCQTYFYFLGCFLHLLEPFRFPYLHFLFLAIFSSKFNFSIFQKNLKIIIKDYPEIEEIINKCENVLKEIISTLKK